MKKKFLFIFLLIFAYGTAIGGGIFFAEKKVQKKKEATVIISLEEDKKEAEAVVSEAENVALEAEPVSASPEEEILPENSETTEKEMTGKFSFAVIGDTQYFEPGDGNGSFQRAVRIVNQKKVGLVVALGDIVSSCNDGCAKKLSSWKSVFNNSSKVYALMGNHDRSNEEKSDKTWQNFFDFPTNGPTGFSELTYSFDYENSHFVVLNSEKPKEHVINKVQRDWLRKDLQANRQENTFVFFHEPAYPVSSKIKESLDVNAAERNELWNILVSQRVTAVFSGHEHIHSRKKIQGLYQFVFGNTESFDHDSPKPGVAEYSYRGQNFGLVQVEGKKITVQVFSVTGALLNTISF